MNLTRLFCEVDDFCKGFIPDRTFKWFHTRRQQLSQAFPKLISYNRFIELLPDILIPHAITRCLHAMNPNNDALWQEAEPMIEKDKGLIVLDDSTLDEPYAQKIPLVYRHCQRY
ncbi:MAG: hypothetical protein PHP00_14695 [Thiotrichaceae bacterium]|nr:hypothetical protein [Thiotrichaceae bacterium]